MNTKTPFKIAAAALMLAAATAATAGQAPQVRVGYADLDLDTPAGAAALYVGKAPTAAAVRLAAVGR